MPYTYPGNGGGSAATLATEERRELIAGSSEVILYAANTAFTLSVPTDADLAECTSTQPIFYSPDPSVPPDPATETGGYTAGYVELEQGDLTGIQFSSDQAGQLTVFYYRNASRNI